MDQKDWTGIEGKLNEWFNDVVLSQNWMNLLYSSNWLSYIFHSIDSTL